MHLFCALMTSKYVKGQFIEHFNLLAGCYWEFTPLENVRERGGGSNCNNLTDYLNL